MVSYLKRLALFLILPTLVIIAAIYRADGLTDPYYLRFTTPRQGSLIVGSSQASQGIHPQVLDSILKVGGHPEQIFNYSFSLVSSNYGPLYYQSIRKKLDPTSRNGVFVVSVDPLSISEIIGRSQESEEGLDRRRSILARVSNVNVYPNVEYLLTAYEAPLLNILIPRAGQRTGQLELHEDGWLEIRADLSESAVAKRIERNKRELQETRFQHSTPSPWRLASLAMTVDLLKKHGTVILVWLPANSAIRAMEYGYMPEFDFLMQRFAIEKGVEYFNIPSDDQRWKFVDGIHLTPASGAEVSVLIGEELLKNLGK